jgi:hypothetical protein
VFSSIRAEIRAVKEMLLDRTFHSIHNCFVVETFLGQFAKLRKDSFD